MNRAASLHTVHVLALVDRVGVRPLMHGKLVLVDSDAHDSVVVWDGRPQPRGVWHRILLL